MKLINVEPVEGIIRHPVTMRVINKGDSVEFTPAIARLINIGALKIIEKSKRESAKSED